MLYVTSCWLACHTDVAQMHGGTAAGSDSAYFRSKLTTLYAASQTLK
jgi:hypothetical protein